MLIKHLDALYLQFQDILRGCYPSFVWQRNPGPQRGHLPVFVFHSIGALELEEKLKFLKTNRYQTVTSDEAYQYLFIEKSVPENAVMLTFDDARKSTWSVLYPLLRKYGFKATVFTAPKHVEEEEIPSPNLEDVWSGKCGIETVEDCDHGDSPIISWSEAGIMHESGVIDFQSHSYDHRKVPVSSKITGFLTPQYVDSFFFEFDIPIMRGTNDKGGHFDHLLGAPVYENASCLKGDRMYIEDTDLRDECTQFVMRNGGRVFFEGNNWSGKLKEIVRNFRSSSPFREEFETDEAQKRRIAENLVKAKKVLEEQLPGKNVRHLAYPWGEGSSLSVTCAKEAGYVSNYWSTIPHRAGNEPGVDPFHLVRLKHDFIWRLPGEGRKSLAEVFLFKFFRRMRGEIDYR